MRLSAEYGLVSQALSLFSCATAAHHAGLEKHLQLLHTRLSTVPELTVHSHRVLLAALGVYHQKDMYVLTWRMCS